MSLAMGARLAAFLEERTGLVTALRRRGEMQVPGGARWERSFGAVLLVLLAAQFASGFALALGYAPGTTSAWESVARLESLPLGHLVRALHARGADLLIVALMLHLLQTALHGAFRAPRELSWWLGILLAAIVFGAAFTGALLPWDERSRGALEVAIGAGRALPVAGPLFLRLLGGASGAGNLVLPRAYALHAIAAPASLGLLVYAHAILARRHGPIAPPSLTPAVLETRHRYWPGQASLDALAALLAMVALTGLARARPALLDGPADPTTPSGALRPAWYFRPLTELLRDLPPRLLPLASLLPLLVLLVLLALPLLDQWRRRAPARPSPRLPGLAVALVVAVAAALGAASIARDARSPSMRQETSRAQLRAASARALASQGTPAEGIVFKLHDQPVARGARLFERRCLACHRVGERGTAYGPVLTDYLSRDWIRGALVTPDAAEYYGKAKLGGMESQELDEASLSLLLDLLHALRELPPDAKELPPALESAGRIFESARCGQCHALWSSTHRLGPSLAGYGSAAWLNGLLRDPSAPEYFGAQNQMVLTGEKLSDSERDDLVAYLQTLETR